MPGVKRRPDVLKREEKTIFARETVKSVKTKNPLGLLGNPAVMNTLKEIFDQHAEEVVSEERVRRVLEPVRIMISEGRFDREHKFVWPVRLSSASMMRAFVMVGASAVIMLAVIFAQGKPAGNMLMDIPNTEVSLGEANVLGNTLSGRIITEGGGVGGIVLTLVTADSNRGVFGAVVSGDDGAYCFQEIPDGTYRLKASLPYGMKVADGESICVDAEEDGVTYTVTDGRTGNLAEDKTSEGIYSETYTVTDSRRGKPAAVKTSEGTYGGTDAGIVTTEAGVSTEVWISYNGEPDLVFNGGSDSIWKGVDIELCQINQVELRLQVDR